MLNIISYSDNILKLEEEIKNEGHTLITTLQEISIKKYNNIFGYNYKHPNDNKIEILIDNLYILKKVVENVLLIIKDIRNNTKHIEINDNNLILHFENRNKKIVNSIRRILLSEIEILAFDNIEVIHNSTFMPDEVWKQRIGLIPIKIINENIEIDLNNIENNYFELDKKYDDKINNYVTSNNLININNNIEIVYNDIIINKLDLNQKIHIRAYLKKGTANNNIKWCPVKNIPFRIIWEFYIKKEDILKIIPYFISYNIYIIEDENRITIQTQNKNCKSILKKINNDNNFESNITYSKTIEIEIKSVGQYNSKKIFYKSLEILELKYNDLLNKLNIFLKK